MSVNAEIVINTPQYDVLLTLGGISAITRFTAFTPLRPSDWGSPTPNNGKDAIDELAGRVYSLEQNPVGGGGISIEDARYLHEQSASSAVWEIDHNLGFQPYVFAETFDGEPLNGNLKRIDKDRCTLFFGAALTGRAFCHA